MKKILAEIKDLERKLAGYSGGKLHCDGIAWKKDGDQVVNGKCDKPVSYIDEKGFVYCDKHGMERKQHMRCRKLKPAELKELEAGNALPKY